MVNEEILSGLAYALYRGESLRDAMMTFYNAGYKKEEIEESARALQSQGVGQITSQQTQPTPPTQPSQTTPVKQKPIPKKISKKTKLFPTQPVSNYGPPSADTEELKRKIDTAIHHLKQIRVPSKLKIIESRGQPKPPTIIQKISDYKGAPPRPISKTLTAILVVLLVLLLGGLIAVFFFKEQLIEIFNNFNLG